MMKGENGMGKKQGPTRRWSISKPGDSVAERQDRIAQRAYELYVAKGYRQGCDVEDWLEAERELADAA